MSSVHLYQAEKKDLQNIYDLLIEFKEVDLIDLKLPDVDKSKLTTFINTILEKGKVILAKDLDKNEFIGICKGQMINIHIIYIKKNFRSFKLFKTMIDSVKKIAKELPIVIGVSTGLKIDPVFERLGFENMGSNWRLL
jgi:N-acetylglutamate synthase-like GNAT family acetyltransferase